VFLASSSGAILLMAESPHGLEEVHRLLASSLIGATRGDVVLFLGLLLATAVFLAMRRRQVLLYAMEPAMAEAVGIRVRLWSALLSVVLGFVLAQAIRVSGTLYAFGCLVLPGLAAKALGAESLPLFWRAPLVALAASLVGFVVANHWDLPPAQVTVALLAVAALPSLRRRV
jgi:ABC-type Mn2+/Zn2+ transport system permease subunit